MLSKGLEEASSLHGKIVLVTGSSRGIGATTAYRLAEAGATLILNYNEKESDLDVNAVAQSIQALGGSALIVKCNVSKSDDVQAMMATIKEKYGRLDILVNNAGIAMDHTIEKMSELDWDEVLDVNLKGPWLCSKFAIEKFMKEQRSGKIINVASVVGISGNFGQTNYASSKAGVIGLTKALSKEAARYGVQVNAVVPGFVESSMTDKIPEEVKTKVKERILLGRFAKQIEVANLIFFLSSGLSSYINGTAIVIDGGFSL